MLKTMKRSKTKVNTAIFLQLIMNSGHFSSFFILWDFPRIEQIGRCFFTSDIIREIEAQPMSGFEIKTEIPTTNQKPAFYHN